MSIHTLPSPYCSYRDCSQLRVEGLPYCPAHRMIQTAAAGRWISPKSYLARKRRSSQCHPCTYSHFDCACWAAGPCTEELLAALEAAHDDSE